ncbi:MAG: hypothetical protein M1132_11430 [Chloroflexi bacterium]|nr:hypothetical protein [Chloroflexota bacterium]
MRCAAAPRGTGDAPDGQRTALVEIDKNDCPPCFAGGVLVAADALFKVEPIKQVSFPPKASRAFETALCAEFGA